MAQIDHPPSPHRSFWMLAGCLAAVCFFIRLPNLTALPIFGDEAIYLRWAQLIREGHAWISLCDPKPPLHFWMLAPILNFSDDPLYAARFLSVLFGVASVPALMLACIELTRLYKAFDAGPSSSVVPPSGQALGMLAAVLMVFCPFLAFYQRFATADALFVLEMLLIIWLSLRWARLVSAGRGHWATAIFLGIAFAAAMLTRQGLSYVLWAFPIFAVLIQPASRRVPRAVASLAVAGLVAFVLWSPYLVAQIDLSDENVVGELKRRILYQSSFTAGESRSAAILQHLQNTFIPSTGAEGPATGWLFYYLTPAIYLTSFLGVILLAMQRQWRVLLALLAWTFLLLVLPIFLLSTIYSRYLLAGAVPLLIFSAYALAQCLAWISGGGARKAHPAVLWTAGAIVFAGLLVQGILECGTQSTRWYRQTFVGRDRYQYLTGWNAGGPSMEAIAAMRGLAKERNFILITEDRMGTPADAAWAYLKGNPSITLYTTPDARDQVLLRVGLNSYRLGKEKYLPSSEPVELSDTTPVFFITNDPVHLADRDVPAEDFFRERNPNLGPPVSFSSIADGEKVLIFPVKVPVAPLETRKSESP